MTRSFQDAIVLFGDSLTQDKREGTLWQLMSEAYERKLDVQNRGLGGYTTKWAKPLLQRIFPSNTGSGAPKIKLITIWLGTNDAALDNERTVSLEDYINNLDQIVSALAAPDSPQYTPHARLVLITPHPVVEGMRAKDTPVKLDREHTRKYKDACLVVGKEWAIKSDKVQTLDLWKLLVEAGGGETEEALRPYYTDGVHMTPKGYRLLFDELMRIICTRWESLDPQKMKMSAPRFDDATGKWDEYNPHRISKDKD